MPERILLLDTGKEWGGGTNSMLELLKRIDRTRFVITPLFYDNYPRGSESDLRSALADIGLDLQLLPRRRQPWWAKLGKELARGLFAWAPRIRAQLVFAIELAWRIRPDALRIAEVLRSGNYAALYVNNQPSSNLEGLLAAEMAGVPVIQHCRIEATLNAQETTQLNRIARRVICVSQGVADSLIAQGVDAALCRVVLNGVDGGQALPGPTTARQTWGYAANDIVIGSIGSLVVRKGTRTLLDALRSLPGVRGLIVGDGPQRAELEHQAQQPGLAGRITFTGFLQQPLDALAAMDIFCLASAREGLPRVILEAMLLGKPVVSTDIPGCRELVRDGETGYLVPHGDTAALTEVLRKLCDDPVLRGTLGRRGREVVLAKYSIERYVAGVEAVFEEVLS